MRRARVLRSAIVLKPSTLLHLHSVLRKRKYRMLFSPERRRRPGPKGPQKDLIDAVVAMKRRNPGWGCPRIAQQIALAFGVEIDKDVVSRLLSVHYRPETDSGGPSWLTFLGHMQDSLWSCAECFIERFAGAVCQNASARIMIRCIDSTNGKPIFGYSRSRKSRLFLTCRFHIPS